MPCSKIRNFLVAAAVLIASLGFAAPVFADTAAILNPDGKLTYLGTLSGADSYAAGINDAGQVVGYSDTAGGSDHAFITGLNGVGMRDLGTLGAAESYATGINNAGQVIGSYSIGGYSDTFITGPNGVGMTALNTGGLFSTSSAYGINDAGQVVGYSLDLSGSQYAPWGYSSVSQAFITGPNGVGAGVTDFSIPDGDYSVATGINDAGQATGYFGTADGSEHAFITGHNGVGVTELGTLGGTYSKATGINGAGQVVGESSTADGSEHAFITDPDGMGMTDLGTLGGTDSFATGVNDAGQVVGYSDTADGSQHAFITGPNGVGMTDLNSLVVNLPGGDLIETASGINNHGQVIVTVAGVPAVPEPETYAMLLAGLALTGFMARLRKAA
jgi:probable HAF family extracellular repeat protein